MGMHLLPSARRAPYSDWLAQVERHLYRLGKPLKLAMDNPIIQSCYDVGLLPSEVAQDIVED